MLPGNGVESEIQSKRICTVQMFGSLRSMARESGYDRDKR